MSKDLYFEMREEELAYLVEKVERGERNALTTYAKIKQLKELYASAEKKVEKL